MVRLTTNFANWIKIALSKKKCYDLIKRKFITLLHKCWYACYYQIDNNILSILAIGLMSRVFANGLGDWGSIQSRVIPKTQKIVLDAALLNTQHYKVRIKGKVKQSREME